MPCIGPFKERSLFIGFEKIKPDLEEKEYPPHMIFNPR
jgi:hypothetical protein